MPVFKNGARFILAPFFCSIELRQRIQSVQVLPDSRFRRNDKVEAFFKGLSMGPIYLRFRQRESALFLSYRPNWSLRLALMMEIIASGAGVYAKSFVSLRS
jgi:hypothetical protein